MKRILMIAAIALFAVACNKNQKAVKKLDGTWNATSVKITEDGGLTVDILGTPLLTSVTQTFDGCVLKDDEFCQSITTSITPFGTSVDSLYYRVSGDGTVLESKEDLSSTTIRSVEILELTNSRLRTKLVEDGRTVNVELEKQ